MDSISIQVTTVGTFEIHDQKKKNLALLYIPILQLGLKTIFESMETEERQERKERKMPGLMLRFMIGINPMLQGHPL